METFWKILKALYIAFMVIPPVVGLLMIATGNGSSGGGTWKQKREQLERERIERNLQQYQKLKQQNTYQYQNIPVQRPTYTQRSRSFTPDDAYDEGYDEGYEQGREDGSNGYSEGYGYDDSSDYYDYYETRYEEGYEVGYEDGYYEGRSDYEEEREDDDW